MIPSARTTALALSLFGVSLALFANSNAQEKEKREARKQIGVLVEYIQLDAKTASKLVREYAAEFDATEFRDQLETMIEAEQAQMIESSYLLTSSGQRAKVQSVHHFQYPIDYWDYPSGIAGRFVGPGVETGSMRRAFDHRSLGHIMEFEAAARDGTVALNLAPQIEDFVGYNTYGKGEAELTRPLFFEVKFNTNLTVPDGGYLLASVQMPRDKKAGEGVMRPDKDSRILVFVKATVLKSRKK